MRDGCIDVLLEEVVSGRSVEPKEGDGVGDHPDVGAAAVVVGLGPRPVRVLHHQDLVRLALGVRRLVVRVRVVVCKKE